MKRNISTKRRAEIEAELNGPPLPRELSYLWKIFCRIASRRGGNGFSALPLTWSDIDAFCRLTRTQLQPFEIEIIEDLDALYLAPKGKG